MKKIGKSADDIFSRKLPSQEEKPSLPEKEPEKLARGRPQEHFESWTKTTVVLLDKQIQWLDELALDIRKNTKIAVSRAEIIRGILAAVAESGVDLSQIKSETEIKNLIASLIRRQP